ncbi:helix-turn-helix domain-containing protein [Streptomyces sp. IB2014 016-6]|uniref:helix-turn-helix domain-containing protein n=1 Tax=Streptomyces sp. IB2014 016-6 TaxID=2517818 RepID=UPI0011CB3840|nr:helix-turn-helix domain-containing protein [Streptomyces sp. IB2014 016-6]TXL90238.1 helix-turn-helix domain-containing protein [Streptomyces sp. IB2014 016-6]
MKQSTTPSSSVPTLPSPKERRRLREAMDMTEKQVATAVGVTRRTVRSWETGRTTPLGRKRETYARLLAAYAAEIEEKKRAKGGRRPTDSWNSPARKAATAPAEAPAPASAPPPAPEPRTDSTSLKDVLPGEPSSPSRPTPSRKKPLNRRPVRTVEEDSRSRQSAQRRKEKAEAMAGAAAAEAARLTPAQAFDELYAYAAPALVRQTYLLTGRRTLAQESVERAFQLAWHRWPEVAVDADPAGWVRGAAYDHATAPWHRFRRACRHPDPFTGERDGRALRRTLLDLPPMYRRTLLLHDGLGIGLPETAAETEATTTAATNRLLHAREAVVGQLPDLGDEAVLFERMRELARTVSAPAVATASAVRLASERRAKFWTRVAIAVTVLIIGATAFTVVTAPTRYEPTPAPGQRVGGVPAPKGPQKLDKQDLKLRDALRAVPVNGPGRLVPRIP